MKVNEALKVVYMSLKNNTLPCPVKVDFAGFFNTTLLMRFMKTLSVRKSGRRFMGLIDDSFRLIS